MHGITGTFAGGSDQSGAIVDRSIVEYENNTITNVAQYVFYISNSLKKFKSNSVTNIGESAFYQNSKLSEVDLPNLIHLGNSAFFSCSSLKQVIFPKVTSIGGNCFYNCQNLQTVDLSEITSFGSSCFYNCKKFKTLILRNNEVVPLGSVGIFNLSAFASNGTGGTLYVPQALIASYQATNAWSTILGYPNNQIKAIEGSIYE